MRTLTIMPRVTASLLLAVTTWAAPVSADVPWITDVQRGKRDGLQTNRPVLLDFWASWCGPCSTMDVEVFSQERVATAMRKIVPVRVDIDRHEDVARTYRVNGTPTLIVTDGHGNELLRHSGLISADRLIAVLEALPQDLSRINALSAAVERDKDDGAALSALGEELRRSGLYVASAEHYRRALKTRAGRQRSELRAAALLALGRNQAVLRDFAAAEKTLAQLLKEFPDHPEAEAVRKEVEEARRSR
jgi:thioredoxin 1